MAEVEGKMVGLICDPCFEEHETGPGHPEKPERLKRCRQELASRGIVERSRSLPVVPASDEMLLRVHEAGYVRTVERACAGGLPTLDAADTAVCTASERIARLAAGSVAALAREVAQGAIGRGFAAVRPPGHHAERAMAMGFCLYNNVAVAAEELRQVCGLSKVLIVDWDVHHGNGTQHIFEEDPGVFYYSVHQWPLYPGTGAREERGSGAGRGATLNSTLPPGSGDDAFLSALRDELVPAADRFRPEFVVISAGFDAHRDDPLANLEVTTEAYAEATRILLELAERHAGGRLISVLEGGYDLDALAASVAIHVETLLER